MIGGYFQNNRNPMVPGEFRIIVPNIGLFIANFLIDTGSDDIIISSFDAMRLGISGTQLNNPVSLSGVGSPMNGFPVSAEVMFRDGSRFCCYDRQIYIADPTSNPKMPSILGQEIIQYWDMHISAQSALLDIVPVRQDSTMP